MSSSDPKLLTRDEFTRQVRERDKNRCVKCGAQEPELDAHHLMERKLWPDGGYYLDNGVSLCSDCHPLAEDTTSDPDELRKLAGIANVLLPPHLAGDTKYDKWGNPILPSGMRLRGELFYEENVQKVLEWRIRQGEFSEYVKYPRTPHVPWSPHCRNRDDLILTDCSHFEGKRVVVTVKMDGENTTMYRDHIHARSMDSRHHPSRSWVKGLHAQIAHDIPEGWRVCGENCFAEHSIRYDNLSSYFLVFSIWDERNNCLSYDEMLEYTELLGLHTVPLLYRGVWDEEKIRAISVDSHGGDDMEGYVVRVAEQFPYGRFLTSMAKWVRASHVQTDAHWMSKPVVKNGLWEPES